MATQADLFLAILALDACNRGYNPGMIFNGSSDAVGTQIGDATILQDTNADAAAQAATFYAIAYNWEGETVISYRGTTNPVSLGTILTGWSLGIGFAAASQAQMALQFYAQVESKTGGAAGGQTIELTGHSLGGGLELR
ncbi:MAG: hypothetical protein ACLQIQ_20410 [Beijerinckiaceae bacterium]